MDEPANPVLKFANLETRNKKPKKTKIPTSKVNVPEFVGLTNPFIKKEAPVTKKEVISKLSDKVTNYW